jgi:glutamate synthase (NADPH/NADH) small chain
VLAINDEPVTIKSIERAIVDKGWEAGWIVPQPPQRRSGFAVAVVGSGPAGLACAQQLNRAGHAVTVYERDDAIGGLMTYGIPDFKFAKSRVRQRVRQLELEGVAFRTNVDVGRDVSLNQMRATHDAVCLAIGALEARDLKVPGRSLAGVELAMPYLVTENRRQAGRPVARRMDAAGLRVVVLGGGDTGADCVATANRQRAATVTQVDINLPRPRDRPPENPWPEPPVTRSRTYAQEEGCVGEYGFETLAFEPAPDGQRVAAVRGQRVSWTYTARRRRLERTIIATDVTIPADLVLIAAGFTGPKLAPFGGSLATTESGTLEADDDMRTSMEGVFVAGDARMGQSIVVWAIGEGRDAARAIDFYLTGRSDLPASLRTLNLPTEWRT